MKSRKPWLAALFSFLCPGLGQLYNGNLTLALVAIPLALVVSVIGTFYLSDTFRELMGVLAIGFVVDFLFAAQAFREAKRLAPAPLKKFQRWWLYPIYAGLIYGIPDGYGTIFPDRLLSFQIPSESMVPNLLIGDRLVADGWAFWHKDPVRGDIITFKYPRDESIIYVKRLVGLPGETIELKDNELYINGKLQPQKATGPAQKEGGWESTKYIENLGGKDHVLQRMTVATYPDYGPVTVPPDSYFMMGDNRDRSSDSRVWGFVKREQLLGRMQFVFFSWDSVNHRIRTERVGLEVH